MARRSVVPAHLWRGMTLAAMRDYAAGLGVDAARTNGYAFLAKHVMPRVGKQSVCELLGRGVGSGPVDVPWHKADGAAAPPEAGSCLYQ